MFAVGSCQKNEKDSTFKLYGKSKLIINNQSKDSIQVSISNWVYLPLYEEKTDSLIAPSQSSEFTINTQTKHYYNLKVDDKQYRLFAITGVTNEISVSRDRDQVYFAGQLSEINEFLKTRSIDSDRQPRGSWYQGRGSISDLLSAYDSITNAQKNQLQTTSNLPSWYRRFESSRLDYINAESKLSTVGYRKKMLSTSDPIPDDYLNQVVRNLPLEKLDLVGVPAYMRFVGWYLNYRKDPLLEDEIPNSKGEWIASALEGIEAVEENLTNQRIKEVLLTRRFTDIIDRRRHIWDNNWREYIKDTELSALIKQRLLLNPLLPNGKKFTIFLPL